ncbi:MAG: DUF3857 domain-containing transglutaminase family protein [Permianibacter sp.]
MSRIGESQLTSSLFLSCLRLLALVFSLPLVAAEQAPTVLYQPAPPWVLPTETPVAPAQSEQESDYLLFDSQFMLRQRQTARYFRFLSRPNTPSAISQLAEISIIFDPNYETLVLHEVAIVRNGQRLPRLQPEKVKLIQQETELGRSIYNGSWTALFVTDDLRLGDLLDYSYSIVGHNPVFGDKYIGVTQLTWRLPVQKRSVRLITDPDVKLNIRSQRSTAQLRKTRQDGLNVYSLELSNQKADSPEDRIPQHEMPYDYLEYSEFEDWRDVLAWALPLYDFSDRYRALDELLQTRFDAAKTLEEKVESAIRFVQDDIRYFGIEFGSNSHRPSEPIETFKRRYGDCKDKAALLVYALRNLGIKAHPALVSASSHSHVSARLPSPLAFDHVIVNYTVQGRSYWVDPTYTEQGGNQTYRALPNFKNALLIRKGESGLVDIKPAHAEQIQSSAVIREKLTFPDSDGQAMDIQLEIEVSGWRADELRAELRQSGVVDFEKGIKEYYQKLFRQTDSQAPMSKQDDNARNQLRLNFAFRAKSPHTDAAARAEYEFYASLLRDYILRPSVLDRKYPFMPLPAMHLEHHTEVVFPANRKIIWFSTDRDRKQETAYFSLHKRIQQTDQKLSLSLLMETKGDPITPDAISDYVQLTNTAIESIGMKVWTDRSNAGTSSNKSEQVRSLIENLKSRK